MSAVAAEVVKEVQSMVDTIRFMNRRQVGTRIEPEGSLPAVLVYQPSAEPRVDRRLRPDDMERALRRHRE